MIYQVSVNQAKNKQFLQMMELMTDLGVILSISSENGHTYTMEELKKAIEEGEESGFVENFDSDELLTSLHEKTHKTFY